MKYIFSTQLSLAEFRDKANEICGSKYRDTEPEEVTGKSRDKNTFSIKPPELINGKSAPLFKGKIANVGNTTTFKGEFMIDGLVRQLLISWFITMLILLGFGTVISEVSIMLIAVILMTVGDSIMITILLKGSKEKKQTTIDFINKTFKCQ